MPRKSVHDTGSSQSSPASKRELRARRRTEDFSSSATSSAGAVSPGAFYNPKSKTHDTPKLNPQDDEPASARRPARAAAQKASQSLKQTLGLIRGSTPMSSPASQDFESQRGRASSRDTSVGISRTPSADTTSLSSKIGLAGLHGVATPGPAQSTRRSARQSLVKATRQSKKQILELKHGVLRRGKYRWYSCERRKDLEVPDPEHPERKSVKMSFKYKLPSPSSPPPS